MAVIQDIIAALWQHDFAALADPHIVSVVYFVMFATLFLENGLLPASFLPGRQLVDTGRRIDCPRGYGFSAYDCDSDRRSKSGLLAKLYSGGAG